MGEGKMGRSGYRKERKGYPRCKWVSSTKSRKKKELRKGILNQRSAVSKSNVS